MTISDETKENPLATYARVCVYVRTKIPHERQAIVDFICHNTKTPFFNTSAIYKITLT